MNPLIQKGAKRPFVIAGPCSAETPEQLLETAQRLKANVDVQLLRAGIWKPRTRPDSFEGVGAEGLPWLVAAVKHTLKSWNTNLVLPF